MRGRLFSGGAAAEAKIKNYRAMSAQAASAAFSRRARTYSMMIGRIEISTITIAIASRFSLIHGMLPRKNPSKVMPAAHSTAPMAE